MSKGQSPIGVFDSGVGGLSVLREIWRVLPGEKTIYVTDQAHVPYGTRSLEAVRAFSEGITQFLLNNNVKMIVVACNTASAAALSNLRKSFPQTPFVGMEPAVKPAAEKTLSGVVGVLATPATFQGALYTSVLERFANEVQVLQNTCPGLVERIEAGDFDGSVTRRILNDALIPMLSQDIDTVVLGCTHYPFVIPLIQEICGPAVRVIDPAPAVARQVRRVLENYNWLNQVISSHESTPDKRTRFLTSGDPRRLEALLNKLLNIDSSVNGLAWVNGRLITA